MFPIVWTGAIAKMSDLAGKQVSKVSVKHSATLETFWKEHFTQNVVLYIHKLQLELKQDHLFLQIWRYLPNSQQVNLSVKI